MSDQELKDQRKDSEQQQEKIRYVDVYESSGRIYTRKITGFFQKLRRYTGLPLLAGFLLMPWFVIDDRPAMLFDLSTRQFHILWLTFGPQDAMLLSWLLIIAAFSLFTVTVLVGRVWCGFTCPQTVWTMMFIWAEHFFEGDRNKRIKLDQQPMSPSKFARKFGKHAMWVTISLITGITFIGYFTPVRELITGLATFAAEPISAFWVLFFAGATYLNAGYMREQVCKYMCPYARFQSVMYDQDTLTVFYDYKRGEARGPRKPDEDAKAKGLGDCIDCSWCVQVCPVDIDIRDGVQLECIDCGLCVDACNSVMDKMGYDRGLIRFTTEEAIKNGTTHVFRPRLIGYAVAVLLMIAVFAYTVSNRVPIKVDVLRDRGANMYRVVGDDIQNVYTLKILNLDPADQVYRVEVRGEHHFTLGGYRPTVIEQGELLSFPVRVSVPRSELTTTKATIEFYVESEDNPELNTTATASFIGPTH
ncbi:cytochrome c oxidase accessory protein CcoG [Simiduia curdlanivorans]|uniref:Cytochrome c oxidase accessory protein CcoG n=1 Tax=Simiduia curdlanivorans TaxID=1492769 RepID=A0ABV8V528_9GAMM|nr:cytochrome c oxidase accessory protein CcoG [Simiduia curdlanivorans]MDN3640984.1 cytochrome c oxidase accessory protein CcoG [Simiduia curdlanivorans]